MHHGQESSNSPVMDHALRPRVAIMNNGTRKGGEPFAMMSIHTSPGFEDLWQIHFSLLSGQEYTTPGMFIANGIDEPVTAMPIAPMAAPRPAPWDSAAAGAQRQGLLDQGVGAARRHLHRHQSAQRFQQDLRGPIAIL